METPVPQPQLGSEFGHSTTKGAQISLSAKQMTTLALLGNLGTLPGKRLRIRQAADGQAAQAVIDREHARGRNDARDMG